MLTKTELIDFEKDIAAEFEAGHIQAPCHLHGGNEEALIGIFAGIQAGDWVFSTHRSHYHALLKGIPQEVVKRAIMAGNSISLQFPDYHFYTSAIVGGIVPIALGVAMTGQRCWVFVGDMAATTGIYSECLRYAEGHNLPIRFVVEDNGMSVDTPTQEAWGIARNPFSHAQCKNRFYRYERTFPHQGSGVYVVF